MAASARCRKAGDSAAPGPNSQQLTGIGGATYSGLVCRKPAQRAERAGSSFNSGVEFAGRLARVVRAIRSGQDSLNSMAKTGFGEHLRREREMRGVSLEEISSATRIQGKFLEAIEAEQWEKLPGGVFNRGFVKSVAHYLGLDEEAILGEYTLATGDRGTPSSVTTRSLPLTEPRTPFIAWIIVGLIAILLAAGGFYGWRRYEKKKHASEATPQAAAQLVPSSILAAQLLPRR